MDRNDQIVTRYMADGDFQAAAYPILAREIFDAVEEHKRPADRTPGASQTSSPSANLGLLLVSDNARAFGRSGAKLTGFSTSLLFVTEPDCIDIASPC